MSKIWFVTGSSRGLGRSFVEAALERGDRVAATARNTESLGDLAGTYGERLLALPLDVTDKACVFDAVGKAHAHFGGLDVVVNNSGYGHFGMVEELTEGEVRELFETNFYGTRLGHPGRPAAAAGPGRRPHRPGHLGRWRPRPAQPWQLRRFQVVRGGAVRVAGRGGLRAEHQGHHGRAPIPPTGPAPPRLAPSPIRCTTASARRLRRAWTCPTWATRRPSDLRC
jgi:NAD(P)-dependent dehydrogenase (short-subunit alcohol dehydrogenase family)